MKGETVNPIPVILLSFKRFEAMEAAQKRILTP